jgi:hypothetical protein
MSADQSTHWGCELFLPSPPTEYWPPIPLYYRLGKKTRYEDEDRGVKSVTVPGRRYGVTKNMPDFDTQRLSYCVALTRSLAAGNNINDGRSFVCGCARAFGLTGVRYGDVRCHQPFVHTVDS